MSKYTAPAVILVLMIIVAICGGVLYFTVFSMPPFPLILRIGTVAGTLIIIGILTAVFVQRVQEIKRGEEDDLGKY